MSLFSLKLIIVMLDWC